MVFQLVLKPLAEAEVAEAFDWYAQPHIGMGGEFLAELERTCGFLVSNPYLYVKVEADMRCAHLNRFPYLLAVLCCGW